jgi:hypothetical protein
LMLYQSACQIGSRMAMKGAKKETYHVNRT